MVTTFYGRVTKHEADEQCVLYKPKCELYLFLWKQGFLRNREIPIAAHAPGLWVEKGCTAMSKSEKRIYSHKQLRIKTSSQVHSKLRTKLRSLKKSFVHCWDIQTLTTCKMHSSSCQHARPIHQSAIFLFSVEPENDGRTRKNYYHPGTKQGNVSQKNKTSQEAERVQLWIVFTHTNRRSQGARCLSTNQQW